MSLLRAVRPQVDRRYTLPLGAFSTKERAIMPKKRHYGSSYEAPREHREHHNDERKNNQQPDMHDENMAFRRMSSIEQYAGMEPSRRRQMEDGGMIHEDHRAIANLPQEVMIKAYPMTGPYMPEELEDNIRSVDGQMDLDDSQRRRGFFPKKV
jgi:hypothetical protein